ncbi:MAG: AMP-binding protein, partial [Candidatus Eremiobacteraeota bacterium]|nr:AMP-binding protein [Candidatus Eremiobacteraeota bacterium]
LKALALECDATLFMVLLAGFAVLLHRYGAGDDVVVGSAIDARDRRELQALIGYLTHTVALRTKFQAGESFRTLVSAVRATCLGAYEHQSVPYEKLASELHGDGEAALFSVMFVLQGNASVDRLGEALLSPLPSDTQAASFDLVLSAAERAEGLYATLQYRTALFDAATIERLLEHLGNLLAGVVADPDRAVDEYPLQSARELATVAAWNATETPHDVDETLVDMFARAAAASPDAAAVECGERVLSYSELDLRSRSLARELRRRGVAAGSLVGVFMERSSELVVALLGVMRAGAAYVPLDASYPSERIAYMLETAGRPLVLTQPGLAGGLPAGTRFSTIDEEGRSSDEGGVAPALLDEDEAPLPSASPESLAYVIFTSGSTGRPKGAMIRHRGLANYLRWCVEAYDVRAGIGSPVHSSISFDLTVTSLWAPLVAGKTAFVLPESEGVAALAAAMRRHRNFSLVKLTPAHLDLLRAEFDSADVAG